MSIPILDFQNLDSKTLDTTCAQWGFFALQGHDIPLTLSREVLALCEVFFNQSATLKNKIRRSELNMWGYYDAELTKNRRDWKEIIDIGPAVLHGPLAGSAPQWPDIDGFQEVMSALSDHLHEIGLKLVSAIATALGVNDDVTAPFNTHTSFLRLNFYPPCPEPAEADHILEPAYGHLGISHHTDAGAVTMLLQDNQPGLQVHRESQWHTVDPIENGLVINIGDIVQVWSNDRYVAPLHRVLANSSKSRISTPYFLNPGYDYDYAPLLTDEQAHHYKPINWGHFRAQRSAGDYADFGTEIQISDFKVANNHV